MAHGGMVEVYVDRLLGDRFGQRLRVETDGGRPVFELPLEAAPVVRVVGATGPGMRVLIEAEVALEVTVGPALLDALNEVNARLPYGRMFVLDDRVVMEDTVLGNCVDRDLLHNAVDVVCWAVAVHGPGLAQAGGGRAAVVDDPDNDGRRAAGSGSDDGGARGTPDAAAADTQVQEGPAGSAGGEGRAARGAGDGVPAGTPTAVNAAGYL